MNSVVTSMLVCFLNPQPEPDWHHWNTHVFSSGRVSALGKVVLFVLDSPLGS